MKKYVIKRKDVCAGELIKTIAVDHTYFSVDYSQVDVYPGLGIIAKPGAEDSIDNSPITYGTLNEVEENSKSPISNFFMYSGIVCRGMLFSVNESGKTNDLIWTTPTNYSIAGLEDSKDFSYDFVIKNYVELEELLKYLKFGEDLTQHDLRKIYKRFVISDYWIHCHRTLFGWKKLGNMGYGSGGVQTIPMDIYQRLSSISITGNGKPNENEPNYKQIVLKK